MRRLVVLAVFGLAACATLGAHHSYADYDRTRTVDIEGVVEAVEWAAPHVLLKVRSEGKIFTVEWQAPSMLARRGLEKGQLSAGDRLVVRVNPRRDIAESGLSTLCSIRRPSDGWSWPPLRQGERPVGPCATTPAGVPRSND